MGAGAEMTMMNWHCALCGSMDGLEKYEVLISRLTGDLPGSRLMSSFQRHLCGKCAPGVDDVMMKAVDAAPFKE